MLTEQQIAERSHGIGGSDAAQAIGVEAFGRNRITLWREKTGRAERDDISGERRVRRGNFLEEYIAKEYCIETGVSVRRRNAALVHPAYPFMRCNVDRLVVGARRGLECKSVHPLASKGWGEPGSDEVPMVYLAQCVHMIAITGFETWDLAAMFGDDLRIYTIRRNLELEQAIIEREADFWSYVEKDEPPPPATVGEVLELYPRDNGKEISATDEIHTAWSELLGVRSTLKLVEEKKEALEAELKLYLGERGVLLDPTGKIKLATWLASKSSGTDWKAAALELVADLALEQAGELDVGPIGRTILEKITSKHERPGVRKLLIKEIKTK